MTDHQQRGRKAAQTAKEKHGDDFHAKIGQKGGKEQSPNVQASKKDDEPSAGRRHNKNESTR